jgi:iron complex outermembrane receptor protein
MNPRRSAHHHVVPRTLLAVSLLSPAITAAGQPDDRPALDEIIVTGTRITTMIQDEPLHVEAVPTDEIEENLTVQPGNLSSLLNELPGVHVQPTAPGLGGVGLRLRGMPARHSVVLIDGLPLLGADLDSFGLLQTPPLDLARVEVIKGAASALYGGSALGGVLNLVSQTAAAEPSVLANATSLGSGDVMGFLTAKGASSWSGTLTAGAHYQSRQEIGGEGWADVPGYRRVSLRPRASWSANPGQSLSLTAGISEETREGGTMPGRVLPDGSSFPEALRTRRVDGGATSLWALDGGVGLTGRLSLTSTRLDQTFGGQRTISTQTTAFAEEALTGVTGRHAWVLGVAFQRDKLSVPSVPGVSYTYNVPAIFAQDEVAPVAWLKFAGSARIDANNNYGTFLSPRLSALMHWPQSEWTLRASVGGGFAAPTPSVDEVEATSLGTVLPLHGLHAERAITASLDAKWAVGGWDVNASIFTSEIRDPLEAVSVTSQTFEIVNAPGSRRAPGAEALIRYVAGPLHLIGSWTYVDATESRVPGERQNAPLVPRHSAELGGIIESEKRGRVGLELSYTGRQALVDDPFRRESEPYFELNALGEIKFGGISIFLNAVNLTNARQTHYDPLVRPTLGPGGNPITDVWAPLEGRVINIGLRTEL